jgi:hypothetical protein
MAFESVAIFRA